MRDVAVMVLKFKNSKNTWGVLEFGAESGVTWLTFWGILNVQLGSSWSMAACWGEGVVGPLIPSFRIIFSSSESQSSSNVISGSSRFLKGFLTLERSSTLTKSKSSTKVLGDFLEEVEELEDDAENGFEESEELEEEDLSFLEGVNDVKSDDVEFDDEWWESAEDDRLCERDKEEGGEVFIDPDLSESSFGPPDEDRLRDWGSANIEKGDSEDEADIGGEVSVLEVGDVLTAGKIYEEEAGEVFFDDKEEDEGDDVFEIKGRLELIPLVDNLLSDLKFYKKKVFE